MDFGVVLQTNPPAWRTVQLAELSEAHGFDYVWTFTLTCCGRNRT